ncbi:MAG TPA: metallophosphoesterase [Geothrix sp.]|nr:metallophosphoesterase [Geothrix sp.]
MRNSSKIFIGSLFLAGLLGCSLSSTDYPAQAKPSGDVKLTILQTTDVHHHANGTGHIGVDSHLATMDAYRGIEGSYARMSAYVNQVRSSAGNEVVLVDSGDWSMGTIYDLTLGQQPLAMRFIDTMRYDCVTLGNHEFDYTPKGLATMLGAAEASFTFHTPIVASNVNLNGNTDLAPYIGATKLVQPTHVEVLPNGLRVGYIGLMGKAASAAAPASAPVSFTDFSANYAPVQTLVDGLRTTQKCDVVIALSHSGTDATGNAGEDVDLARHVTGIDVIASGHMHNPLSNAHTVTNGGWTTQIICSGAYGTNVARIDLTVHIGSHTSSLLASSNVAMTDAALTAEHAGLKPDAAFDYLVRANDQQLNQALAPIFTASFPDYNPADLSKGIFHTVGLAAQDMLSNERNPVLCPSGLGSLTADAVRATPNGIIVQVLMAMGWNGSPTDPNLPDYLSVARGMGIDPTFFQGGLVATGVLRGTLKSAVPLSFTDIYNVLPLGITPDTSQALPVGYPLVSAYLELADLKKICALQLVAQTNLVPSDFYLNLSGIKYDLKATESGTYFKYASAAAILQVTSQKAAMGSTAALQALMALSSLGTDSGAALLAASGAGNPFATAMVNLNESAPSAANLQVLGEVAATAAADATAGTTHLNALIVGKALAAIDTVSGFAPSDAACTGATAPLPATGRYRLAADLYAVLMMGAAEAQFGQGIIAYQGATGSAVLSAADMPGLLSKRINADPTSASIVELKEWMALLNYVGVGLGGSIDQAYASTPMFTDFPTAFGPAVTTRNASYPLASIGQLMATLQGLTAAP